MKLLHVAPSFFPATLWGGPIFSTKAICDWVAENRDVDLRVLTTDAVGPGRADALDLPERTQRVPEGYEVTYYPRVAGNSISPGLAAALPAAVRWADVVHLTATYSFPTLPVLACARLLRRPVIWSPHGAIQAAAEWEDAPRKRIKRGFEKVASVLAPRVTALHVTAQSEAAATGRRMPNIPLAIIPNSVEMPEPIDRAVRNDGRTRLMYLSRVHEKKGLSLLIEALKDLPDSISLDIYGNGEQAYIDRLHAEIAKAGVQERVVFHGHVEGADKTRAFAEADIFVLPTYSENFGIVVAEALAYELPVITTDRTPWTNLEQKGCGLCISPEVAPLKEAILRLSSADLRSMGQRGRAWAREEFSPDTVHAAMYEVYRAAITAQEEGIALQLADRT